MNVNVKEGEDKGMCVGEDKDLDSADLCGDVAQPLKRLEEERLVAGLTMACGRDYVPGTPGEKAA